MAGSTVFAVDRLNWRATRFKDEKWELIWQGFMLMPGSRRLRSFDTTDEADAFCAGQEQGMRARVNPFTCGGPALHFQTSLDADRLHDWLLDAGLEPPGREEAIDWRGWWVQASPKMNEAQRLAVWQALDRVRFHRVVERPRRGTAYIVTSREWEYNDQWYDPRSAEGAPVEAYSTYEKAEAARSAKEGAARNNWRLDELEVGHLRWATLQPGEPLLDEHDHIFAEEHDHLFYDIVEVEIAE